MSEKFSEFTQVTSPALTDEVVGLSGADNARMPISEILALNMSSSVIVREASDFGTIDSSKAYIVDGIVDMGNTSIEIPSGGITIKGLSFDISGLISTENSYTMFTSPVGGSGNILMADIAIDVSGTTSQVFDLVGDTGFEACEFERVNWNNCTSMGEIDTYRQGLESGTGRFGGSPQLTLTGAWVGGWFVDTSIVRSLAVGFTGSLYKAGTAFAMASRFRSNQNIDLPASASFFDFAPSQFTNPSTVQMDGCIISRDGIFDASDSNITPNMSETDLSSEWSNNNGMPNTFVGGEYTISSETATTITIAGTFVDLAGTLTTSNLTHFDSPSAGQLRHLGTTPIEFSIGGQMVLVSGANDEVDLKTVIWRAATTSFEDGKTTRRVINNLLGGRNVAYFVLNGSVTLNQNDYVKLQVANVNDTDDVTAELDSFLTVQER